MPKNKNGGNKAKKQANHKTRSNAPTPLPSPDQRILIIKKVFGNCFFEGSILTSIGSDEKKYQLKLHKGARRYGWVGVDSIVLASHSINENQYDILYLYNGNDVHFLKRNNIIPSSISNDSTGDDIVTFTNEEQESRTRVKNNDDDYNNVIPDDYFHPRHSQMDMEDMKDITSRKIQNIHISHTIEEEKEIRLDDIDFDTI
jgi:hypothetical protein